MPSKETSKEWIEHLKVGPSINAGGTNFETTYSGAKSALDSSKKDFEKIEDQAPIFHPH